jgi:hypothetical protein
VSEAGIRKQYADDLRLIADRVERGSLNHRLMHLTPEGSMIEVRLPEDYPIAPGGIYGALASTS